MLSIIIPTLWKSKFIFKTIDFIANSNAEVELIIIDNANSDYTHDSDKITIIKPNRNLFVNPSWNLGVSIAKYDYVCLLNDDVYCNINLLLYGLEQIINYDPEFGIFASHIMEQWSPDGINSDNDSIEILEHPDRVWGYGMMMIMKKENYTMIPSPLKVFFGDDFLYAALISTMKKRSYWLNGFRFFGEFHASSKPYESGDCIRDEHLLWEKIWPNEQLKLMKKQNI